MPTPQTIPIRLRLQFVAVSAAEIRRLGSEAAVNVLSGDLQDPVSTWMYDGDLAEEPVIRNLEAIGNHALERSMQVRRNAPSREPWGKMMITPAGVDLAGMYYTLTEAGYYIPVPHGLIKEPLIRELNEKGTLAMRYELPPEPGTSVTYYV